MDTRAMESKLREYHGSDARDAQHDGGFGIKNRFGEGSTLVPARGGVFGVEIEEGGDLDRDDEVALDLVELGDGGYGGGGEYGIG